MEGGEVRKIRNKGRVTEGESHVFFSTNIDKKWYWVNCFKGKLKKLVIEHNYKGNDNHGNAVLMLCQLLTFFCFSCNYITPRSIANQREGLQYNIIRGTTIQIGQVILQWRPFLSIRRYDIHKQLKGLIVK